MNSLFLASFFLIIFIVLLRLVTEREKIFFYILMISLLPRIVLVFFQQLDLNRFHSPYVFLAKSFNDGEAYSSNAILTANVLRDRTTQKTFFTKNNGIELVSGEVFRNSWKLKVSLPETYEVGYITYLFALFYAAFGFAPAVLSIFNVILSLSTALLMFSIAKRNFNDLTAYISSTLFLFWPTVFYYSASKLKDPLLLFFSCLLLLLWSRNVKIYIKVPLTLFSAAILECLRTGLGVFFLVAISLQCYLDWASKKKIRFIIPLVFIGVFIIWKFNMISGGLATFFQTSASMHKGQFESGGHVYSLLGANANFFVYGGKEWLRYLVSAWYHFLFEPLYATSLTIPFLLYSPFKTVFSIFCILAVAGAVKSFNDNRSSFIRRQTVFICFGIFYGTVIALSSGNVGTMLRHRDLITPVVFIYGAFFISCCIKNYHGKGNCPYAI